MNRNYIEIMGYAGADAEVKETQTGREMTVLIQALIADSIQYILHIQRRNGRRYASTLAQVLGYDHASDRYRTASRL